MPELRLHANENPWGPVDRQHGSPLWQYPLDMGALEHALAEREGLAVEQIVLGNGSTELISLLILALCPPDGAVACCAGSFVAYRMLARAAGRPLQLAAPGRDGGTCLEALRSVVDARTRLVFIANPDNPSGTLLRREALRTFLGALPPHVVVVLDEAYREYVDDPGYPDATEFIGPRCLTLRTFSKAYGLAGIRCGYALCEAELASRLRGICGPFRVGRLTRAAAEQALADEVGLGAVVHRTRRARADLLARLREIGLEAPRSHTSFVMVELGQPAAQVAGRLAGEGIRVQPLDAYGHPGAIRLSVGEAEHHALLVDSLREVLPCL